MDRAAAETASGYAVADQRGPDDYSRVNKQEQLARVEADLARGHTYPALQRLANLTGLYPDDLDLRARRAAVFRQIGNLEAAGRWGFLTEDVTGEETAAFERAFWNPADRLRALRLSHDPAPGLGPLAATRFEELRRVAKQPYAPPSPSKGEKVGLTIGCGLFVAFVLGVLVLAVIGGISLLS
jgi:hypothetical protein